MPPLSTEPCYWPPGPPGAPGSVWRVGASAPDDAAGADGDFYLRTATGDFYKRVAGHYVLQGNLRGPAGTNTVVWNETPAGAIDGVNAAFTLAAAPANALQLFKNGLLQRAGGNDFTLAGSVITFVPAAVPLPGDVLLATYGQ